MKDYILALRPTHWIKNTIVLAAFFFALGDGEQAVTWCDALFAVGAAALFCIVSSAVYVMNDIRDISLDREHPFKKERPIAAGRIPLLHAYVLGGILAIIALAGSIAMSRELAVVIVTYFLVQVLYSFGLKRIALLDVFVIASGFVLRALAGAVALSVAISPWLLLCTFLLALFLGFCKRRHEKVLLMTCADENRPSLAKYDEKLLDQMIAIVSGATVVSYALYTLSPDTVVKFGSARLGFTIPIVMYGLFRYLDLVYRREKGNKPERILLTDTPLLVAMVLYGLVVLCIFSLR